MEENTRIVKGFTLHEEPLEVELMGKGRPSNWPFAAMKLLETVYVTDKTRFNAARSAITYMHRTTDMRFHTKEMPTGMLRLRVQRVK